MSAESESESETVIIQELDDYYTSIGKAHASDVQVPFVNVQVRCVPLSVLEEMREQEGTRLRMGAMEKLFAGKFNLDYKELMEGELSAISQFFIFGVPEGTFWHSLQHRIEKMCSMQVLLAFHGDHKPDDILYFNDFPRLLKTACVHQDMEITCITAFSSEPKNNVKGTIDKTEETARELFKGIGLAISGSTNEDSAQLHRVAAQLSLDEEDE